MGPIPVDYSLVISYTRVKNSPDQYWSTIYYMYISALVILYTRVRNSPDRYWSTISLVRYNMWAEARIHGTGKDFSISVVVDDFISSICRVTHKHQG